jgi:hypothetical protein
VRWGLALAFCAAAAAATWVGAAAGPEHPLRVEIGYALATSDPEDADNNLGNKYWDVSPPVTVESEEPCDRAELTTRADTFFNGEPGFGGPDGPVESELVGDGYRFEDRAVGPGDALAGETVRVTATARCFSGRSIFSATARREFELPAASCDGGPLRVGEVEGRVTAVDWDHEEQGERVLLPGFLISAGSDVTVARGARVELGAPECNGFRVTLDEGLHAVGTYAQDGRGDPFSAERATAVGDSHAGGVQVPRRAIVWPLTFRCRGCHGNGPSSYEVRSTPDRTTVRVFSGAVLVGVETPPTLRVPAGHQASVLCSENSCRAGHVRLFHPDEPWSTPADLALSDLPTVVQAEAPTPAQLAPQFSRVGVEWLAAAGRAPDQAAVSWSRTLRSAGGPLGFEERTEQGFLIWQRVARDRWRLVYSRDFEYGGYTGVDVGDVTGDGHNDVLLETSMGTGACGPRRLVAYAGGRTRELFARDFCEGSAEIAGGSLKVTMGVGPCPEPAGSVHCHGGISTELFRWSGAKVATSRRTVECNRPTLDPARDCVPRKQG